jgi:transcriptional regulator with XRE-family HTH domain
MTSHGAEPPDAKERSDESSEHAFPSLLKRFRERSGLSQNSLAERAGRDPGTINRLESGKRAPVNRQLIEDVARALDLGQAERAQLLAAAGHLSEGLARIGLADPDIRLVADILGDETIPAEERRDFRLSLRLAARRWRSVQLE